MTDGNDHPAGASERDTLLGIATDGWRLARLFARVLTQLDAGVANRYVSQLRFYTKSVTEKLEAAGLRIVSLEGQPYDPGVPASALNIGDFSPEDQLVVDQMLEPIIMGPDGLVRAGTIMLRKVEQP